MTGSRDPGVAERTAPADEEYEQLLDHDHKNRREMRVEPLSDRCEQLLRRGEHALVGVSLGNSYFTPERLAALLGWAVRSFDLVDLVYVDVAVDEMYRANGRSPESAARSVKGRVKDVRRAIRRAYDTLDHGTERIRSRGLSELLDLGEYRTVRRRTDRAVDECRDLSLVCTRMVREIISARRGDGDVTAAQMRAAMNYVKAEAPLMVDSPAIFGVGTSVVLYHRNTPIFDYLAHREGEFQAPDNQGYVVVRPADHPPRPSPPTYSTSTHRCGPSGACAAPLRGNPAGWDDRGRRCVPDDAARWTTPSCEPSAVVHRVDQPVLRARTRPDS